MAGRLPIPFVDEKAAELLFRQKVLVFLEKEGLVGAERLELLDSWKSGHAGFSAHKPGRGAGGRLAGCRAPRKVSAATTLSLERLELDGAVARYRHKQAARSDGEAFDRQELLARLLAQQQRFDEAESLMLEAYAVLVDQLGPSHRRSRGALEKIIDLYDSWGRADEAAKYRRLLASQGD